MLKITGMCMADEAAVEFLEMLPDNIPTEIKDEDFCEEYERMLNTVRYHIRKSVPVLPKEIKPVTKSFGTTYSCGQCGYSVRTHERYCAKCGRQIRWS